MEQMSADRILAIMMLVFGVSDLVIAGYFKRKGEKNPEEQEKYRTLVMAMATPGVLFLVLGVGLMMGWLSLSMLR